MRINKSLLIVSGVLIGSGAIVAVAETTPPAWVYQYIRVAPAAWFTSKPGGQGAAVRMAIRTSDASGQWMPDALAIYFEGDRWTMPPGTLTSDEALYLQSDLWAPTAGAGEHIQHESSIGSQWPATALDPYAWLLPNATVNHDLDCGTGNGPPAMSNQQDCSAALVISNNGKPYSSGIIVTHDALDTNNNTQDAVALALPLWAEVAWYYGANKRGAAVKSEVAGVLDLSVMPGGSIKFVRGGVSVGANCNGVNPATMVVVDGHIEHC